MNDLLLEAEPEGWPQSAQASLARRILPDYMRLGPGRFVSNGAEMFLTPILQRLELLARLPTRYLTGLYSAVVAEAIDIPSSGTAVLRASPQT